MKIVIVSRKRADVIMTASMKMFPDALVSIAKEEVMDYVKAGVPRQQILAHPDDVLGLCMKKNWILKNIEDECCVMVDDDCVGFSCLVGERARFIKEPEAIMTIIENAEHCARAIGTGLFTFSELGTDVRKYIPFKPFVLVGYPSGVHGIIGREIWYDENLLLIDDVDIGLTAIKKYRVIWKDNRFAFLDKRPTGFMAGGAQGLRTRKLEEEERAYLKLKWGKYYTLGEWRIGGVKSTVTVERQQAMLMTPEKM